MVRLPSDVNTAADRRPSACRAACTLILGFVALSATPGAQDPAAQPSANRATIVASASPAGPPTRSIAISGTAGGTDFSHASVALRVPWKRKGGDYIDANGVANGPTPHASAKLGWALATLTFDIQKIEGDLLLRFEGGHAPSWSSPLIDGVPADVFWVDASSARAIGAPLKMPAFISNPRRGKILSIRIDTVYQPGDVLVDKVDLPRIGALPMLAGGLASAVRTDSELKRRPAVIRYLELKNEAAVRQLHPQGTIAEPFAFEPQWIAGPNELPTLRFTSLTTAQRLVSWFLRFEPREEVYARYCVFIEDDVADGMTELGVKLPGLAGDEVSWRMEHGPIAPGNRGLYAAVDYIYAADTGSGYGLIRSMGAVLQAGQWYTIEQYVKLNSAGKADGIGKVWINGHLTWESHTVRYRNREESRINHMHVNVYHGGMGIPKAPIHYRLAAIAVADSYIGPPPELLESVAGGTARADKLPVNPQRSPAPPSGSRAQGTTGK